MQKKFLAGLTSNVKETIRSRHSFINTLSKEYATLNGSIFTCPTIENLEAVLAVRIRLYSISKTLQPETQASLLSVFVFLIKIQTGFFAEEPQLLQKGICRISNLLSSEQLNPEDLRHLISSFHLERTSKKLLVQLLKLF